MNFLLPNFVRLAVLATLLTRVSCEVGDLEVTCCVAGRCLYYTVVDCIDNGGTVLSTEEGMTCEEILDDESSIECGACCGPDGDCEPIAGDFEAGCTSSDAEFTPGGSCPCNGACCDYAGGCSSATDKTTCSARKGAWDSKSVTASNVFEVTPPDVCAGTSSGCGSCCDPEGGCQVVTAEDQCAAGSVWEAGGSCPCAGACCSSCGGCIETGSRTSCENGFGVWTPGEDVASYGCNNKHCSGACCFPEARCIGIALQVDCEFAGGIWIGTGVQCEDVTCPAQKGKFDKYSLGPGKSKGGFKGGSKGSGSRSHRKPLFDQHKTQEPKQRGWYQGKNQGRDWNSKSAADTYEDEHHKRKY